jgi:hypothetical protein
MGFFDSINNMLFGTERVKASKAECKEKKRLADEKYKEETKRIEAECEASLTRAKEADKVAMPQPAPVVAPTVVEQNATGYSYSPIEPSQSRIGGKKGGKSKKRSKTNRKKTTRKH